MLDNILDATVVLANGDIVIASEKSHSDLFWGLRGAGHNFGVVTELTYRTHELFPADGHWYIANLDFTNDKLEDVLEVYQRFTGPGSDVGLTLTLQLAFNPELSETEVCPGSNHQKRTSADLEHPSHPFIYSSITLALNNKLPDLPTLFSTSPMSRSSMHPSLTRWSLRPVAVMSTTSPARTRRCAIRKTRSS